MLLRKPRSYAEIYNDLDDEVVGLFRVLRDPAEAERLRAALELTPFARAEFEAAYGPTDDPVERARRLVCRSLMGFGSDGFNAEIKTGFRATSNRSGTTPAHDWQNYPKGLPAIVARLRGVVIENRDALAVMERHDGPSTLHYVDPPYMPETRCGHGAQGAWRYRAYRHEMTAEGHDRLLRALLGLRGMVMISGYPHPLYDTALGGWERREFEALADGAKKRTEVVWMNPVLMDAHRNRPGPLFDDCVAEAAQ